MIFNSIDETYEYINILLEKNWVLNKTEYHKNVCVCPICSELISDKVQNDFSKFGETKISDKNGKAYPTGTALDLSRRHYLNAKINEYSYCATSLKDDILRRLKDNSMLAKSITSYSFDYINKWLSVLESLD